LGWLWKDRELTKQKEKAHLFRLQSLINPSYNFIVEEEAGPLNRSGRGNDVEMIIGKRGSSSITRSRGRMAAKSDRGFFPLTLCPKFERVQSVSYKQRGGGRFPACWGQEEEVEMPQSRLVLDASMLASQLSGTFGTLL
jgi:hypothetical protein